MKNLLHPGNIILTGFATMVLFMCYLVYQCNHHPTVLVSKNYYEQEIKYQDVINAKNNANELTEPIRMERQANHLVFQLPEEVNRDLQNADVVLYHRADDKKDQKVTLVPNGTGTYSVPLTQRMKGHYDIKVSLQTSSKSYYKEFPVTL